MSKKIELESFVADAMAEMMSSAKKPVPAAPIASAHVATRIEKPAFVPTGTSLHSLFGSSSMPNFEVSMFSDVPKNITHLVPTLDSGYVLQAEEAARLVAGIQYNDKILITGPTGSGKSSLVKQVCAVLGAPFLRINMSADIESGNLFGQLVVRDGATVWEDGPITEAVKYGAVCLIDEWELMPPEISMGLQNLLEDGGYLYLKEKPGSSEDKTYIPHKNFRIICAGNTVGQGDDTGRFSGTMVQNSATLDRFQTTIVLDYLTQAHEVAILTGKTSVAEAVAKSMVKFAGLVRNAYKQGAINLTMSPRTLINWANKTARWENTSYALRTAWFDKLRETDRKVVEELYTKVFGTRI